MTTATMATPGFGVFAYYTGSDSYGQYQHTTYPGETTGASAADHYPNFMYNQQVTSVAPYTTWTYSPLKYWPNEIAGGAVDTQDPAAQGAAVNGKVSFFAYAPYVSSAGNPASDDGIVGMTDKNSVGDPKITYKMSNVDLLWGTMESAGVNVVGGANAGVTGNSSAAANTFAKAVRNGVTVAADLTKQKTDGKIKFAFKHVLAAIGGTGRLKAQVVPSNGSLTSGTTTKVSIESVTITDATATGNNQFTLNLATGEITGETGTARVSSEDKSYVLSDIKDDYATVSSPANWDAVKGLNDTDAHEILKDGKTPMLFMPGTTPKLTINVVYTVWTQDEKLQDGWSKVPQNITKSITLPTINGGYIYTLIMKLGIEDVNFDAVVSPWSTDANENQEVNLPVNVAS